MYDKTKKVLSEHIDLLHRLAGVLFEREKLDADEFLDVMNGKLLPSAQTAAAGIIPAEAAAPETTELPTEAQTEPEANTNEINFLTKRECAHLHSLYVCLWAIPCGCYFAA